MSLVRGVPGTEDLVQLPTLAAHPSSSQLFPYIPPPVHLGLCLYYKVAEAGNKVPAGGLRNPESLQQYPCSMVTRHEQENQILGQTEDAQCLNKAQEGGSSK